MKVCKLLANLGDVNPVDHGGYFVINRNASKRLDPEYQLVILETIDEPIPTWYYGHISIDKCYYTNGILSDNQYHLDKPAWFADWFKDYDPTCDDERDYHLKSRDYICSDDPIKRGSVYRDLGMYYGWENLGGHIQSTTSKAALYKCKTLASILAQLKTLK
jgi:hypothetical protein